MNKLGDFLTRKYLEYQLSEGRPVYVREFASWLGVPPTSYSNWINAGILPSDRYIDQMSEKLGPEIYDVCGKIRPGAKIMVEGLPHQVQERLAAFVADVSAALLGKDPESPEAESIVKTLMDKHGINFISKISGFPGMENK